MCDVCREGERLAERAFGDRSAITEEAAHIHMLEKTDWPVLHSPVNVFTFSVPNDFNPASLCPHEWSSEEWRTFADLHTKNGYSNWLRCDECSMRLSGALSESPAVSSEG